MSGKVVAYLQFIYHLHGQDNRKALSLVDTGGIEIKYKTEGDLYINDRSRAKRHSEIAEGSMQMI